jgi:hypothetical protein
MERITTLANRLAEAILFDWDKEEVVKLAKEVAVACHENIEFASLVKRMREAQIEKDESDQGYRAIPHICILEKKDRLESEVDEYLKKMEE